METDQSQQNEMKEFLSLLFSGANGKIEVRCIREGEKPVNTFYDKAEMVNIFGELNTKNNQGYNIFFGVCPRKVSSTTGTKEDVAEVRVLYADLDAKDFNSTDMEAGKKLAYEKIKALLQKPTVITDSGNGLHTYWLLKTPKPILDIQDRTDVESYLKGLQSFLGADTTHDVNRLLRLPGTFNMKKSNPTPKPCKILELNQDQRYELSDFSAFLKDNTSVNPSITKEKSGLPGTVMPTIDINQLKVADGIKEKIIKGYAPDGDRSEGDFHIICELLKVGHPDEEIRAIFQNPAYKIGERYRQPKDGDRYLALTLDGAKKKIASEVEEKVSKSIISWQQLLKYADTPIEWVVENLIPMGARVVFGSIPKEGKTILANALAMAISTATQFLGFNVPVKRNVLFLELEDSEKLTAIRVKPLMAARGIEDLGKLAFLFSKRIKITNPENEAFLQSVIAKLRPEVIICDTIRRIHSADENSSKEMDEVTEKIDNLVSKSPCTVIVLHHLNKGFGSNSSSAQLYDLRGSSAFAGWIDVGLIIRRAANNCRKVSISSKYYLPTETFKYKITSEPPCPTPDTMKLEIVNEEESPDGNNNDEITITYMEELFREGGENNCSLENIRTKSGLKSGKMWSESGARKILNRLKASGRIIVSQGTNSKGGQMNIYLLKKHQRVISDSKNLSHVATTV